MKKFGIIGEALIDKYNENEQIGGAAFNAACGVSALGNEVFFLGAISTDARGQKIRTALNKYKVETTFVQTTKLPTTLSEVLLDANNERTFTFKRASDASYNIEEYKPEDLSFDWIHFGSATGFLPGELKSSYKYLKDYAVEHHIPYSFDPNYRDALWADLNEADFVAQAKEWIKDAQVGKISDNEVTLIMGEKDLDKAIDALAKFAKPQAVMCVTCGSNNTVVLWDGRRWDVPVTPATKVADTTGAGDAFASSLVSSFGNLNKAISEEVITDIVKKANDNGKKAVEYVGALTYLNQK